ncbi:MAG: flagellar biosynthesis protein FliQ [Spirochaetaceae bacterium]|jgi:flagellar biosynthetic protein FliQ|nr:flagellar biosynthesis protein FliQ [Spirochaetaceae bacterium]
MTVGEMVTLLRESIALVLLLSAPMLITALAVGLIVAILQAATSIQEQTLTFVPKIFAILLVLAFLSGWMFTRLGEYTIGLFTMIPAMAN